MDEIDEVLAERGAGYGPPDRQWPEIGNAWTALLQDHYNIDLPHAIPGHVAALMMDMMKTFRAVHAYKDDNYLDKGGYSQIAQTIHKSVN